MKRKMIKVCGMVQEKNILEVAQCGIDLMGFIFYPPSPRYVGENFVLPLDFPAHVERAGVFVNAGTEEIMEKAGRYGLTWIQLHGKEDVDQTRALKDCGLKILKVFSVDETFSFRDVHRYEKAVDYFLFDTKGKYFGGNARTFDWSLLKNFDLDIPYFLSGGLNRSNIEGALAIEDKRMAGLDLNSGVETAPGLKSLEKIKAMVETIHGAK